MDKSRKSLNVARFKKNDPRETLSQLQDRSSSVTILSPMEELRRKIKTREKEVECKDREFGVRRREYKENVVKLDERSRDVERRRERESGRWYKEQFKLLEIRKREVEGKFENVMLYEKKLKEWREKIESRERKLDARVEEIDLKDKRLKELAEKLKSGKRELEEKVKEANLKEQLLENKLDVFALEKREFEERFREGIARERRWLEGIKELEIREEELQEQSWKIDVAKSNLNVAVLAVSRNEIPCNHGVDTAAGVVVQHCVVMDGKSLQIFLNEHWEEHDKMRDTVSALIRYCSDPAKLVLDAIEGFYPPHLKHRDHEFEASVVRSSCLLLMEELMEIGPNIKPHVKVEAMKLSFDWIAKMSVDSEHSIEVVAFLALVSVYGLADAYDSSELLDYAENVAHHKQIPKLCRALGLAGRIPGLIQNLLKREQHLVALGFIVEFDLVDEFPPANLLDDVINLSENAAEVVIREGNNSIAAQNLAMTKRVAMLTDIVKCIEYHDIRAGFLAGSIEQMINSLKQKASLNNAVAPIGITESNHSDHKDPPVADAASDLAHVSASLSSASCADVTTIAAAPLTDTFQQEEDVLMEALPNPDASANTSVCYLECPPQVEPIADKGSPSNKPQHFPIKVKGLRTLLGDNVAYELVRDEILWVLKSSSDPAHLVLDAIKNGTSKMMGIPVKGCILLLEDVKKLSPVNESLVEAEARQYAKDWISKLELKKDDHLEVICFIQFLLVFDLCCDFEDWEVYGLLDPSCWLNKFTDSCRLLGLSDLFLSFVENLIANKCLLKAIGYICTFKLDDKFPPESLLNNYMMNAMKDADIMCEEENSAPADQIMAMNCKISAVRTALKCIDRYSIGSGDMRIRLQDDVEQLEKRKTEKTQKLDAVSSACGWQDDVKTLRMLLSSDTDYKSVKDEISRVLNLSPEPAYVVLSTIKNVDSSNLKGYIQSELGIPIKNCILLLEQLLSISAKIKREAHDEAGCLKRRWIKKLKKTKDDHMGVLCFIMLHEAYNQSVRLNPAEVIGLLNSSCWKQVSESCRELGLKNVYPESLIQTMIANKQGIKLIKAITYVLEFRLDERFSIASLLNDYLSHSRKNADKMAGEKKGDPKVQVRAIQKKIDAATKVVRCVQQHNLYSLYPLQGLEDEIEQLYKQKEKACGNNGSSSRGLKRDRKHRDSGDGKFAPDTCSFGASPQKKKKHEALERCSSSYAMQPPPPLPPPLQLLPSPSPLPLPLPPPYPYPSCTYPYIEGHMNGPNWPQHASSSGYPPIYPHPHIL